METQIWTFSGRGCGDSSKVLANVGSREEVESLAFSFPCLGFPGRNFHGDGLECKFRSLKGTTDWWKQTAHTVEVRRAHL